MVPKPDGTFRMCVDCRALNDCTADASWPIPNIAEIFRRIGSQKPKIFGIMDLTQGYHQAPLTFATRAYTSFITLSGVYQFTRLCTVSRITERKKALEIRATKRSSVDIVGKMPFCVLEVEKLFS